jgi:hypothetical protein
MLLIALLLNLLCPHNGRVEAPPRFAANDTIIQAIRIKLDAASNVWMVEWLSPIQRLDVILTRVDGKQVIKQTFNESANGEFELRNLQPGIFILTLHRDNELPFHRLVQQKGMPGANGDG